MGIQPITTALQVRFASKVHAPILCSSFLFPFSGVAVCRYMQGTTFQLVIQSLRDGEAGFFFMSETLCLSAKVLGNGSLVATE